MVVIAHGPWWTEWHHFLPLIPAGFGAILLWFSSRKK